MVSLACMYVVAMYVVTSLSSCTVIGCHVILLFKCMCIPHKIRFGTKREYGYC